MSAYSSVEETGHDSSKGSTDRQDVSQINVDRRGDGSSNDPSSKFHEGGPDDTSHSNVYMKQEGTEATSGSTPHRAGPTGSEARHPSPPNPEGGTMDLASLGSTAGARYDQPTGQPTNVPNSDKPEPDHVGLNMGNPTGPSHVVTIPHQVEGQGYEH